MKSIQTILFEDLKFIDISHREVGSAVSTFPEGYVSDVHNVQLITKNNHIPTTLFKFIVSGGKYTGLGEGRPTDLEGLQMKKILQYAKQVSEFTEIPLWEDRDVEISLKNNHQYECPKCGHKTNTAFYRCMYCGFQETKESLG
jgi:DNA-directed RNA polymerase subunit RPC12/RpoP